MALYLLKTMKTENIILDFDGTLTNLEKEASPMLEKWNELFSEKTGFPYEKLKTEIENISEYVKKDPSQGWKDNNTGEIVARADADPYTFHTVIYQNLLEKISQSDELEEYNLPKDKGSQFEFLKKIFGEAYPYAQTSFREGEKATKQFLDELTKNYNVSIVTNSKKDSIVNKLEKLKGDFNLDIKEDAKKYKLDNSMEDMDKEYTPSHFPQPVKLRRGMYKDRLDELKNNKSFKPKKTSVIGDIFEFDLALPEYMDYNVIQIHTPNIKDYEIKHHKDSQNNFYAENYQQILNYLSEKK